jgi:hypothetical protein
MHADKANDNEPFVGVSKVCAPPSTKGKPVLEAISSRHFFV